MLKTEVHLGRVVEVEPDFTKVALETPRGDAYERFFDTEFLSESGLGPKLGEEVKLTLYKETDGSRGTITLIVEAK